MARTTFRAVAGGAVLVLTCGLLTLPAGAASAAVRSGASSVAGSDSTLSALAVSGSGYTPAAPAFAPETHDYQLAGGDGDTVTVSPTTTDDGASTVVTSGGSTQPLVSGIATVPLTRGRNDITLTVTSSNGSSSTSYTVTAWRLAAPTSRIVGLAGAHSTVLGGARMTVTLTDGSLPQDCYRYYQVGSNGTGSASTSFDPATGLTKEVVVIPAAEQRAAGIVDLVVTNVCYSWWTNTPYRTAETTAKGAVTYTAGFPVTSADIPDTVTSGTHLTVHGTDVVTGADARYWIEDAQGRPVQTPQWGWNGDDTSVLYVPYSQGGDWYAGSGERTFHAGYCPLYQGQIDDACTSVLTRPIHWVQPTAQNVAFAPTSGPTAGGTKVRLRGRFVVSGSSELRISVGGVPVSDATVVFAAAQSSSSFDQYTQAQDVVEFHVPAGTAPGPVPVTVTNDVGTTVARSTFTYSPRPTITSLAPTAVANSGGSTITVQGTGFGTTGRPTVIIDGTKSPLVSRISATRLTAVVPDAGSRTGPVQVTVTSAQGGGVSTPATLTLTAPGARPTAGQLTPAAAHAGDAVTLTGTGLGTAASVGVTVDGLSARITASTATAVTFEVPPATSPGARPVRVATSTGSGATGPSLTVLPDDAITDVAPATVPSYAVGSAARIALEGNGFGATGTVQVGAAAAVPYTATAAGTRIAGVVVPTDAAGQLPIVVVPTGAGAALRSSVRVIAPTLSYVGSDPHRTMYQNPDVDNWQEGGGQLLEVAADGGTPVRVEGAGFGPSGTVLVGATAATSVTWTDTVVTFLAPAHAAGTVPVTLTPTGSTLAARRVAGVRYVVAPAGTPAIDRITSVVDLGHPGRNEFSPRDDTSDVFTLTGVNLDGASAAATRVVVSDNWGTVLTVVPASVTATSLTFAAPRGFEHSGWKSVRITTDTGQDAIGYGLYYLDTGPAFGVSPWFGSCLRTDASATGGTTQHPATVSVTSPEGLLGSAGTATVDGVTVGTTGWSATEVTLDLAALATDLANPWGSKAVVLTPTDPSVAPQRVRFNCALAASVDTTANGSTTPLTVAAGTDYTLGNTTSGFIGTTPFVVDDQEGYEYVSVEDFEATGWSQNVEAGRPVTAGDYYVRVAGNRAAYAREKYLSFEASAVRVTVTGSPLTLTPVSDNGSTLTYKGQLGDGSNGSSLDVHAAVAPSAPVDPITTVHWQYRNAQCAAHNPNSGWADGLPRDVAISGSWCGGDNTTLTSWQVRVKSVEMTTTGVDRSIYYRLSRPITTLTITPKDVTITALRADRGYDGTVNASVGEPTVSGTLPDESIYLDDGYLAGTFVDPAPGVDKPVTLTRDLTTPWWMRNYRLTNHRPTVLGTISKASASLGLTLSESSVVLSQHTPVTATAQVRDTSTGQVVDSGAGLAPVVLTSDTPSVCTVSEMTVTAVGSGTCVVGASQAASTNYNASTAQSDPQSTTESAELEVYPAKQTISVVADDLAVAVGDPVQPTSEVNGLFDGDTVDNLGYDYYSGSTLLPEAPTAPGRYKVVPKGGTLNAANSTAYTNPTEFGYVAGALVVTAVPPAITRVAPASGPTTGGSLVVVTGTRLEGVRSIQIGAATLRANDFAVGPGGTRITFRTPAAAEPGPVDLVLVAGSASATDTFTYTTPPVPPTVTVTRMSPVTGPVSGGTAVSLTGTHLNLVRSVTVGTATLSGPQLSVDASGSTLTFYTPRVAAAGPVGVVLNVGTAQRAGTFTYTAPPVLGVPGPPVRLAVRPGDRRVVAGFGAPLRDGGSPVTGYQVSVNGSPWRTLATTAGAAGTRRASVTGLLNGVAQRVQVRSVNAQGAGLPAAPVVVVPNAPRPAPIVHPRSEIAVPKNPRAYRGPRAYTRARYTAHNGTDARPVNALGARQLVRGEAAGLYGGNLFAFNSATLSATGRAQVKAMAAHLRLARAVTCEGYSDYAGDRTHELSLSTRRAIRVCRNLIAYGVKVTVSVHGYGGSRPVVVGGTARSRGENRRVVVLVTR